MLVSVQTSWPLAVLGAKVVAKIMTKKVKVGRWLAVILVGLLCSAPAEWLADESGRSAEPLGFDSTVHAVHGLPVPPRCLDCNRWG
eukprot:COSAG04_NODE_73_length_29016_cov_7.345472_6_plen_86_part_00